jgi:nucleotide-binding universal stress UspA family protein
MENPHQSGEKLALVCVGRGEIDKNSLSFTKDFLTSMEIRPIVFHVLPPGSAKAEADALLETICEEIGIEGAESRSTEGKVKEEILHELERQKYQLIVLGTTERNPELTPSRLSQDIANRVDVSALILRNPPPEINEILICTGGHSTSSVAVNWGIELAKATQEKVTILHVAQSAPTMYAGLEEFDEDLSQVLSRDIPLAEHLKDTAGFAEESGIDATIELRHGYVTEEILRACEMRPHHLIVIGAPKPSIFNRILFGRIAPKLLASTHRSTLIIREGL